MNKKVIIIIPVILILILISILLIYSGQSNEIINYPECDEYRELGYGITYWECIADLAIERNNEEICKNSGIDRNLCLMDFYIANEDLNSCKNLKGISYEGSEVFLDKYCEGAIIKDKEYCVNEYSNKESESTYCLWGTAVNKPDVNICQEIKSDSCISDIAHEWRNINACEYLKDESSKDNCIIDVAVLTNDISLCESVEGQWSKEICLEELS